MCEEPFETVDTRCLYFPEENLVSVNETSHLKTGYSNAANICQAVQAKLLARPTPEKPLTAIEKQALKAYFGFERYWVLDLENDCLVGNKNGALLSKLDLASEADAETKAMALQSNYGTDNCARANQFVCERTFG